MDYKLIILEIIIIFSLIFILNMFIFTRKNKKLNVDDMPLELIYLTGIYGIDPKKINFKSFRLAYSIINSFIITTTYMLVTHFIKLMIFQIIISVVLLILLIIICYGLLGRYYLYKEEKNK